jgi:hypothetical protein
MHTVLLVIHVAAGSLGLVVGPLAMLAPKRPRRHPWLGRCYVVLTAALCLSAVGLAALDPAVWWLGVIGVLTLAAAAGGWWVRRRRFSGWLVWHINLMCGSYISFVTAFLIVNLGLGSVIAWVAPTVVGSALIARATVRATRGRIPASAEATVPVEPAVSAASAASSAPAASAGSAPRRG